MNNSKVRINWQEVTPGHPVGIIHGDGLKLELNTNYRTLEIRGDGCRLKIGDNHGQIRMIGDGNQLEVFGKNSGKIECHGDGGRVVLNDGCISRVRFVGEGGQVSQKTMSDRTIGRKFHRIIESKTGIGIARTVRLNVTTKKIPVSIHRPD